MQEHKGCMRRGKIMSTFNDTVVLTKLPSYFYAKDKITVKCLVVK